MIDKEEAVDIALLKRDFDYLKEGINDIKALLEKRDVLAGDCRKGFDGRITKLEDTEKKVKIYIAAAIFLGGAVMYLVDKALEIYSKLR
jgi:hypothetical protein